MSSEYYFPAVNKVVFLAYQWFHAAGLLGAFP
jgi:hypothetical protein